MNGTTASLFILAHILPEASPYSSATVVISGSSIASGQTSCTKKAEEHETVAHSSYQRRLLFSSFLAQPHFLGSPEVVCWQGASQRALSSSGTIGSGVEHSAGLQALSFCSYSSVVGAVRVLWDRVIAYPFPRYLATFQRQVTCSTAVPRIWGNGVLWFKGTLRDLRKYLVGSVGLL